MEDTDGVLGMAWWNGLSIKERRYWMAEAGNTGRVSDAWEASKHREDLKHRNKDLNRLNIPDDLTEMYRMQKSLLRSFRNDEDTVAIAKRTMALIERIAHLEAPVSDEELVLCLGNSPDKYARETASWCRAFFDALIAARACSNK